MHKIEISVVWLCVMRPKTAFSARGLALVAVFCSLYGAEACGRENFDLLQAAGPVSIAGEAGRDAAGTGGSIEVVGGVGSVGSVGSDRGGSFASAGLAGSLLEGGSLSDGGSPFGGGASGSGACPGGGGCATAPACAPAAPFCTVCERDSECLDVGARTCDLNLGRCVGCRNDDACPADEHCDLLSLRCATSCTNHNDCAADLGHTLCDVGLRVCVSCLTNSECGSHTHTGAHCYQGACVECFDNTQCNSQACIAGHCLRMH